MLSFEAILAAACFLTAASASFECPDVICPVLSCPVTASLIPDGECCPVCPPAEPPTLDCRLVLCAKPDCDKPLPPPIGQCCPICPPPPPKPPVDGCFFNGKFYKTGSSFPAGDGCNTCFCLGGNRVACTKIACRPRCKFNGVYYNPGDTFPAGDGCNTCICLKDGSVACTEIACLPPA